jgi:hypothetical protein
MVNLNARHHMEDLNIGRRIIWTLNKSLDWIYLAQDTDRWLALVKAVMNLRVP